MAKRYFYFEESSVAAEKLNKHGVASVLEISEVFMKQKQNKEAETYFL